MEILSRNRRLRKSDALRQMVRETSINTSDLIAPLFLKEGPNGKEEITSMPGIYRYDLKALMQEVQELYNLGIKCVSLFPVIDENKKNPNAMESINPEGIYQLAIKEIKHSLPEMLIMTDVALDPYSSDGHDGLVDHKTGQILNDETLEILCQMAVLQAASGSDIIGPSDMMDYRVGAIRKALEAAGYKDTLIMSYTAKYASNFYGPFRDALNSAPKKGDKKTYQMDYGNASEALRELQNDEREGADIVMVKPGLAYLDIIKLFSEHTCLPIAAYNVSGEYAMIKAAAKMGWIDENKIVHEILTAFKRAGASMVLTYFAKDMAKRLNE
ncbi:MAG: delta-aminolevulinic acid dehydratase [Bdellovibrionales bacterium RIFOXYA1_FULL_36_14]|nr:MAG: delta-aminolevulinic acid dehydratase [Bdellovibrionales bacterium RIFOXYA1_FULL_36_14]